MTVDEADAPRSGDPSTGGPRAGEPRSGEPLSGELSLEIAAQPRYVGLTRLFVAGAARDAGCDEGTIDDIKIAVSEAVTSALRADGGDGRIEVRVWQGEGRLQVAVERPVESGGGAAAPAEEVDLGMAVISALFPDASGGVGGTVRFAVPLTSGTPADQH